MFHRCVLLLFPLMLGSCLGGGTSREDKTLDLSPLEHSYGSAERELNQGLKDYAESINTRDFIFVKS